MENIGKSVAKFILFALSVLISFFGGLMMFNHVNPWLGILWIILTICLVAIYLERVNQWIHNPKTKNKKNQKKK